MKKILSSILVLMLVFSLSAFAAPSITVDDLTSVSGCLSSTGVTVGEDFKVDIAEENAASTFIRAELEKFLNEGSEFTITAFFSMDAYEAIVSSFPDDVNIDTLAVHEIIPIDFTNYKAEYGSLTVTFSFPAEYDDDEAIIVVVGIMNPTTSEMEWISLPVFVNMDNEIEVIFDQETIEKISNNDAVLLLLND